MDLLSIIAVAVGLSMDCFAVTIASAASNKSFHIKNSLSLALAFGGFQGGMALIGWLIGSAASDFVGGFDHWLAFLLLLFVGAKMIREALVLEEEVESSPPIMLIPLLMLSLATSIDALAVGASFGVLKQLIIMPSMIIGATCFTITLFGGLIGEKVGHIFENKIEIAGGLVVIGIGLKILFEHLLK